MGRQFDDVHYFLSGSEEACLCHLLNLVGKIIFKRSLKGTIMEADKRGMEVEVCIDRHGVS